jgi:hypothetical protein
MESKIFVILTGVSVGVSSDPREIFFFPLPRTFNFFVVDVEALGALLVGIDTGGGGEGMVVVDLEDEEPPWSSEISCPSPGEH